MGQEGARGEEPRHWLGTRVIKVSVPQNTCFIIYSLFTCNKIYGLNCVLNEKLHVMYAWCVFGLIVCWWGNYVFMYVWLWLNVVVNAWVDYCGDKAMVYYVCLIVAKCGLCILKVNMVQCYGKTWGDGYDCELCILDTMLMKLYEIEYVVKNKMHVCVCPMWGLVEFDYVWNTWDVCIGVYSWLWVEQMNV